MPKADLWRLVSRDEVICDPPDPALSLATMSYINHTHLVDVGEGEMPPFTVRFTQVGNAVFVSFYVADPDMLPETLMGVGLQLKQMEVGDGEEVEKDGQPGEREGDDAPEHSGAVPTGGEPDAPVPEVGEELASVREAGGEELIENVLIADDEAEAQVLAEAHRLMEEADDGEAPTD